MNEQYPVIVNGVVAIIMAFLSPVLIHYGIDSSGVQSVGAAIGGILLAIISVVSVVLAHRKVTPVANPKNNDGTPLVPATEGPGTDAP